jgi:hydrogenase/urease accessory protein HupE
MRWLAVPGAALAVWLLGHPAVAHPLRTGYLEITRIADTAYRVHWTMPTPDGVPSDVKVVFDPRCAPASEMVDADTSLRLDRTWTISCPGALARTLLVARGLQAGQTDLLVRIVDGAVTVARLTNEAPALVFATAAAGGGASTYFVLGLEHILFGLDHLLFVLGLLLIVADRWMLVKTVTAFTLAHSITLAAATLGWVHVPAPPLNAAIALSIMCLGVEVVRSARGETGLAQRRPWLLAFAFGLLHGLGFASGLIDLGLPRAELPLALLLFNLGVEAGQLAFVAGILLLERALRLLEIRWPRPVALAPAYLVGVLGAYWAIDRIVAMFGGTG